MKISAHAIVKNEGRFIWYSIMSVINSVDEYRIIDTGSSDSTIQIVNHIKSLPIVGKKVHFEQVEVEKFQEDIYRNKMLADTQADYIWFVDGDEIWWEESIKGLRTTIEKNPNVESFVVPTVNMIGDLYHKSPSDAGRYQLAGRTGHLNLRVVSTRIPGLNGKGTDSSFKWVDAGRTMIQYRGQSRVMFVDTPYLHCSHVKRSDILKGDNFADFRSRKYKYEIGDSLPLDYYYPEILFKTRPSIVPSVWEPMDTVYRINALIQTPLKKIKRKIL